MYAHDVLDSIPVWEAYYKNNFPDKDIPLKALYLMRERLPIAQKFHMGDIDSLLLTGNGTYSADKPDFRLPYDTIWVSGVTEIGQKFGALVYGNVDNSKAHILPWITIKTEGKKLQWIPLEVFIRIPFEHKDKNVNITLEFWMLDQRDNYEEDYFVAVHLNFYAVEILLAFLDCKNIGVETVMPDAALNKKRSKRGKPQIFSYHTLVIKPVGKRQESIPRDLWNNRIHLARGHFKTYTEEKPLFGKITGKFWWQPQVRGRNRDGVVMKDYEIRGVA